MEYLSLDLVLILVGAAVYLLVKYPKIAMLGLVAFAAGLFGIVT